MDLDRLLKFMTDKGASDLHLKPMRPPLIRVRGRLLPIPGSEPLKPADLERMLLPLLNQTQKEKFDAFIGSLAPEGGAQGGGTQAAEAAAPTGPAKSANIIGHATPAGWRG